MNRFYLDLNKNHGPKNKKSIFARTKTIFLKKPKSKRLIFTRTIYIFKFKSKYIRKYN